MPSPRSKRPRSASGPADAPHVVRCRSASEACAVEAALGILRADRPAAHNGATPTPAAVAVAAIQAALGDSSPPSPEHAVSQWSALLGALRGVGAAEVAAVAASLPPPLHAAPLDVGTVFAALLGPAAAPGGLLRAIGPALRCAVPPAWWGPVVGLALMAAVELSVPTEQASPVQDGACSEGDPWGLLGWLGASGVLCAPVVPPDACGAVLRSLVAAPCRHPTLCRLSDTPAAAADAVCGVLWAFVPPPSGAEAPPWLRRPCARSLLRTAAVECLVAALPTASALPFGAEAAGEGTVEAEALGLCSDFVAAVRGLHPAAAAALRDAAALCPVGIGGRTAAEPSPPPRCG